MKRKTLLALSAGFLVASAWAAGCGSNATDSDGTGSGSSTGGGGGLGEGGNTPTGGTNGASGGTDGTGSSGTGGTPIVVDCEPRGGDCETGDECCSGLCDGESDTCAQNLGTCSAAGTPCSDPTECCSFSCIDGGCQDAACTPDTESCSNDDECCSGSCADGTCEDLNGSISICKSAGNPCDDGNDCCSKLCSDDGVCLIGSSYCVQLFDACTSNEQCCYGTCNKEEGASLGYCEKQMSTGSGCDSKLAAGEVCGGDCSLCCSRSCAPFGPSGLSICQPPSGCRPSGELCRRDEDCCGGDADADLPGAGNGACEDINSEGVGRCKNTSCTPQGGICKVAPEQADAYDEFCGGGSTSPNNCCNFLGNATNCALDGLNIPRCDAIDECREAGEGCATSDDCCGGLPCVQDESGAFVCYDPPGGDCVPSGGPCTNNGDCCVGTLCLLEPGDATGTCGITDTGTGGTSGMGGGSSTGGSTSTGGSNSCAEYGQACESSSDCCNDVPCDASTDTCRFGLGG